MRRVVVLTEIVVNSTKGRKSVGVASIVVFMSLSSAAVCCSGRVEREKESVKRVTAGLGAALQATSATRQAAHEAGMRSDNEMCKNEIIVPDFVCNPLYWFGISRESN